MQFFVDFLIEFVIESFFSIFGGQIKERTARIFIIAMVVLALGLITAFILVR